jgi:uncharacterized YigZ family protein
MTGDSYRTLSGEGTAVVREKASRFLAWAFAIADEDDFKLRMQAIAREHHASRHVCYAWVLGVAGDRQRANDAGEPSGTAGRPILNRILSVGLTNCAVVVVRYFGGTLLGKAGLIEAYGAAAAQALASAPVIERMLREPIEVICSYKQLVAVRAALQERGGELVNATYDDPCVLLIELPRRFLDDQLRAWQAAGIAARRCDQGK